MSILAAVSMGILLILETRAHFFSTTLETDLSLLNTIHSNNDKEPYIRLNFDITMMDLPCEQANIDIYSAIGYQKNITRNIRKYPIDETGVRQRYEASNWHQNDIELWDPAVVETIDDLHHDGEDAISLDANSFPYGEQKYVTLFVACINVRTGTYSSSQPSLSLFNIQHICDKNSTEAFLFLVC